MIHLENNELRNYELTIVNEVLVFRRISKEDLAEIREIGTGFSRCNYVFGFNYEIIDGILIGGGFLSNSKGVYGDNVLCDIDYSIDEINELRRELWIGDSMCGVRKKFKFLRGWVDRHYVNGRYYLRRFSKRVTYRTSLFRIEDY